MPRDLTTVGKWKPASLVVVAAVAILFAAGISRITPGHATAPARGPGIVLRGPATWPSSRKFTNRGRPAGGTPTPASTPSPC